MKLYNTQTRQKEEFIPLAKGKVKMYSCGPTVYNYFHIGNARPFIIFDILRRYLTYKGFDVTFVQNFTDIDDKVINKANEEGVTFDVIADKFIKEYYIDAEGLGIEPANYHPKATDCMEDIIDIVKILIDKGLAYNVDGDVYYRTSKFEGYGKLSGQNIEELESGARVDVNEQKENPLDFAIWKRAKPLEPSFNSPWGLGRPGWHIECSAMIKKYLGEQIDIHSGGKDLTFPHHENEIAQSEGAFGCTLARYWLHNGFLTVDNDKMSKSKGNFFMVREAAAAYGYDTIRMFMLSAHYRSPLNYSEDSLKQTRASLERLSSTLENLIFLKDNKHNDVSKLEEKKIAEFILYKNKFIECMDDDINTAGAIGVIFELIRDINTFIKENDVSSVFASKSIESLTELCDILGIMPKLADDNIPNEVLELIEKRKLAKANKDFQLSDNIRMEIEDLGFLIKDTRDGTQITKK